jgi:hypothetical protein
MLESNFSLKAEEPRIYVCSACFVQARNEFKPRHYSIELRLANIFCKGPDSKRQSIFFFFKIWEPYGLCSNRSTGVVWRKQL